MRSSGRVGLGAAAFLICSVATGKKLIIMTSVNARTNLTARGFQFIAVIIIEMVQ
jgi:hypothetical protein